MRAVEQWCVRRGARGVIRSKGLQRVAWRCVLHAGVWIFRMRSSL